MKVRLLAVTQPLDPSIPSASALLAYCARVSSTANQANHETGGKLLRSLVRRKEWSPFEMVSATMEIETTRDIARQMLRHSLRPQEFSQRYAEVVDEPVFRECRMQHPTDRQASVACTDPSIALWWLEAQEEVAEVTLRRYRGALERGIAKEVARTVLAEGLTASKLYFQGTLRSWIHYIEARTYEGTQKEHREIAQAVAAALADAFPDLADVFAGEVA